MNRQNQTRNETQDPTHGRLGLALVAMSFSLSLLPLIASAEQAIEEIVVTAQKREQALQDVPLSVQALTGDLIDSVSMRDFTDVITLVPGASETFAVTATQKAFQIRGVFSGDGDDTVGYYVNDAAYFLYGNGTAPIGRVFDMERVEVLRGPQGTLYGNGSMGGTVRYITKKPNLNEVELHTRTGVSSVQGGDNGNYIDAAVSLPLIEDTLGLRVTGSRERLGGYTTDALGNEDTGEADITSYRGELLWVASDAVELSLLHSYNEGEQDRGTLLGSLDPALNIYLPGDFGDSDESITSFTISWDLSFATLISSTTLIDTERDAQQSVPIPGLGTLELLSNTTGEAINNETRLVSNGDSPLQWIVGTFYSDSEVTSEQDSNLGFIVPFNVQEFNSKSLSFFGEVSYELLDGKLIPLFGVRYFEDDRDTNSTSFALQPRGKTFDSTNPRFNLSWFPNDARHYFVNIAKGFRSGDFNNPAICGPLHRANGLPCEDTIDSDELWSYEIGGKFELANKQVLLETGAYFMDWQDVRQQVQFFAVGQGYSVGDAEIKGIDLSLTYAPRDIAGLTLQFSANWADSEFTKLDPALDAVLLTNEGDELPLVPEKTLALLASYNWTLGGNWEGHASTSFSFIGKQAGLFATTAVGDDRQLLRARFGASNESFGVYLFGNNLLGEDGAIYSQNPVGGLFALTQDYPRQVGIELTYDLN